MGAHAKQYVTQERKRLEDSSIFLESGGWWVSGLDPLDNWKRMKWGQFKPKTPRTDQKGKPIKYESPWKEPCRAIFLDNGVPLYWRNTIEDLEAPIVICEGAKKAGLLLSAGYPAIALPGITMGYRKRENGEFQLIPELEILQNRTIIICFDQDSKKRTRDAVENATQNLRQLLSERGCEVKSTSWDFRKGKGIDDLGKELLIEQRYQLVRQILTDALPVEIPNKLPPIEDLRMQRLPIAKIAWEALKSIPPYTTGDGRYMPLLSMMTGVVTDLGNDGREILTRWDAGKGQWGMTFKKKLESLESGRCSLTSLWTVALSHGWAYPDPEFEQQWKARVEAGESLEEQDPAHAVIYKKVDRRLGGVTRFNELLHQIEIDGEELNPDYLRTDLAIKYGVQILGRDTAEEVMLRLAKQNSYHPVQQYVERVAQEHPEDSEFLGTAATRYLGTTEPLYEQYLRKWLIAVVARVYQPGCKMDTVLTLQGGQGCFKSTFFKSLCHDPCWFDDSFTGDLSDTDGKLKFHFSLICEWAEVETIFTRRDFSACKNLISSATDKIRPPYGRKQQSMPRRSVVVATSNQVELLQDPTGDRRWWIIPIPGSLNNELVAQDRDRLWAAAVHAYRSGEKWHLSPEWDLERSENNRQFQDHDVWEEVIHQWIEKRDFDPLFDPSPFTSLEVITQALEIPIDRADKLVQRRVGAALRRLGYDNSSRGYSKNGSRERVWKKIEKNDGSDGSVTSNDDISTETHDPLSDPLPDPLSNDGSKNQTFDPSDPSDPDAKKTFKISTEERPLMDREISPQIQKGDRVRYSPRQKRSGNDDFSQVCREKTMTVIEIHGDRALVTAHGWVVKHSIPIVDLVGAR